MEPASSFVQIAHALGKAWGAIESTLSGNLGTILGITYAEYRLLAALGASVESGASRVQVAEAVGLTPSGVTRALRPLAELGFVENVRHPRDARLSIAKLTTAGEELLGNAESLLADLADGLAAKSPLVAANPDGFVAMLTELAG